MSKVELTAAVRRVLQMIHRGEPPVGRRQLPLHESIDRLLKGGLITRIGALEFQLTDAGRAALGADLIDKLKEARETVQSIFDDTAPHRATRVVDILDDVIRRMEEA